ncbi:MAG: hypothetical protein HOI80_00380, partial [Alphaproteobacteria bacterium]|nr:hypothetical protein [Alphaproteobacteria bacterium]
MKYVNRNLMVWFLALIIMGVSIDAYGMTNTKYPYFGSVRSQKVNVRCGPGRQYPIEWVLVRASQPVEVLAGFDTWQKIRGWDGIEGWVYKNMLTKKQTAVVMKTDCTLSKSPDENGKFIAYMEKGFILNVLSCKDRWCQVEVE